MNESKHNANIGINMCSTFLGAFCVRASVCAPALLIKRIKWEFQENKAQCENEKVEDERKKMKMCRCNA